MVTSFQKTPFFCCSHNNPFFALPCPDINISFPRKPSVSVLKPFFLCVSILDYVIRVCVCCVPMSYSISPCLLGYGATSHLEITSSVTVYPQLLRLTDQYRLYPRFRVLSHELGLAVLTPFLWRSSTVLCTIERSQSMACWSRYTIWTEAGHIIIADTNMQVQYLNFNI